MKYLTFIRHSESYRESGPPAALMEAMGKFVEKSLKDGIRRRVGGASDVRSRHGAVTKVAVRCGAHPAP